MWTDHSPAKARAGPAEDTAGAGEVLGGISVVVDASEWLAVVSGTVTGAAAVRPVAVDRPIATPTAPAVAATSTIAIANRQRSRDHPSGRDLADDD